MMGIPPDQARNLSLWEYETLLYHWNEAHSSGEVEAPDGVTAQTILDDINANTKLTR